MRKTHFLIAIIFSLFLSACKDKTHPISEREELISATFDSATQKFTLRYSNGVFKTIDAIVDNSVNPPTAKIEIEDGSIIIRVNDATTSGNAIIEHVSSYQYVNNWIFDEMDFWYYWRDKIPNNPDYTLRPNLFFYSLLNQYDEKNNPEGDRFSWIREDYLDLMASLGGINSQEIGFEYILAYSNEKRSEIFAFVIYTKRGSDAEVKGIKRGQAITAIDGIKITDSNYNSLFTGVDSKTLSISEFSYNDNTGKYELTPSADIKVNMESNFAENPILLDSVYTIDDKKVGYLMYNFFARDKGDGSYQYDKELMNTLNDIKTKGATEMVLDLRYNGGGAVSTAIALASALVKERSTEDIMIIAEYNKLISDELKKEDGADYNKDFFIDKIMNGRKFVVNVPNLNLPRLYILVSRASASASELIINGLRPYMDVTLIGEKTYGKNVGSVSIYREKDRKNKWGMQPIVVKYYNSQNESNYTNGFAPDIEIDEFTALNNRLVELGDIEEPLLQAALAQILGYSSKARRAIPNQMLSKPQMTEIKDASSILHNKEKREMIDDVRENQLKKLKERMQN